MFSQRRLAVVFSHLFPSKSSQLLSSLNCSARSNNNFDDTQNENLQKDCVFCKIIRGDSPAFKLYEDDKCLCILDTNPLSRGHSLIIPKCHYSSLEATPSTVVAAMCSKVPFISKAIMKATGSDSFNLLVNNGAAAGQVIFHTHIHIIPRKTRDCLWASESLRRHSLSLDNEASQLVELVRQQLSVVNFSEDIKSQASSLS